MEEKLYEVVYETVRSKLIVEVEKGTKIICIKSTLEGYTDTVISMYIDELEKLVKSARKLMKQI